MIKNKFSKKIIGCQICSSKSLKSIMFYGYIPPVNSMDKIGSIKVKI